MNSVINSTVLSNFSAIGQLDLLHAVTGRLYLPIEIYDEIIAGQLAGYAFYDGIERHIVPLSATGWLELITLSAEELRLISSLPARLHRGEGACLCIARQRGWAFLLTTVLRASKLLNGAYLFRERLEFCCWQSRMVA